MSDGTKTREQLIAELNQLRRQVSDHGQAEHDRALEHQQSLRQQTLLAALLDNIPDNVYFKDLDCRFVMVNKALAFRFGLNDPSEVVGKTDFDFFGEEHARQAFKDEQHVLKTQEPLEDREEKEVWPDGTELWVSSTKMPLYDQDRKLIGTFGISRYITQRKRADEELRKAHEELEQRIAERTTMLAQTNESLRLERDRAQRYLDIAGTLMLVLDRDGKLALVNRKTCEALGHSEDQLVGKDWVKTCIPKRQRHQVRVVFDALMAGNAELTEYHENLVVTSDGEERMVAWHNALLTDETGKTTGVLSSGEDVTERRRAEEAVREGERLEAVGTLASGVAHNFSNILNVITGYASSIADSLLPNTRAHVEAVRILDSSKHALHLSQRLMSVGAAGQAENREKTSSVSLARVMQDTVDLISHTLDMNRVQVHVVAPEGMPHVKANSDRLMEALMSLMMNAVEAMPEGGTITIDAFEREVDKPSPGMNPKAEGGTFAVLRVRDTGQGINRKAMPRIFDPFFTTKQGPTSFGLGLTVARTIVRGWGGWIAVRSKEGSGSSFRLFIPKAAPPTTPIQKERTGEGETVLLIDDDEGSLQLMVSALEGAGFKVHATKEPETGLDLFRKHRDSVDLAIVDLLLHADDESSVAGEILERGPNINLVMTSGFSRDYVRHQLPIGNWGFLQKPFDSEQLLEIVNLRLNRAAAGEL